MWDMNCEDCLPPLGPPSNRSHEISDAVANAAENTATFRTSPNSNALKLRDCRDMVIMAHPPTAKGNLTLTSWRQASASPPQMADRPDHKTSKTEAHPARYKAF